MRQKATHIFAAAEPSSTWGRTGSGESPEATITRGSGSSPPAGSAEKQLQTTASPADAFGSTPPQASALGAMRTIPGEGFFPTWFWSQGYPRLGPVAGTREVVKHVISAGPF